MLGRQRCGRVSRLEATVVGSADLYPFGEASYAQRLPLREATGGQKSKVKINTASAFY
ncbi:MAG: hypothetical protein V7K89_05985 [Nostoc sp.]|uniref:hypothetical protein n=1 Tax=Nostoc sp. TaxID=1180 RepID=UPI002FF8C4D5